MERLGRYVKLLTQLFGDRMVIANATGCSSIWGNPYGSAPYTTRDKDGKGPAWQNSLFEDNAEFGFGMAQSTLTRRDRLHNAVGQVLQGRLSMDGGVFLCCSLAFERCQTRTGRAGSLCSLVCGFEVSFPCAEMFVFCVCDGFFWFYVSFHQFVQ